MIKIALCGLPGSRNTIEAKIPMFLGTSATGYIISEYRTIKELTAAVENHEIYFIDKTLRKDEDLLIDHINSNNNAGNKKLRFLAYTEDPVSEADCDKMIDSIKRHFEYDSMYLAVEFLTDKGLKSIAVSKILYFEYINRKIRIKTQSNEYYCDDTLRNIVSLVGSYGFLQPHKSFIVNLKNITRIKNYSVSMSDGSIIPLSQKKSKEFRAKYNEYMKENSTKVTKRVKKKPPGKD